LAAPPEGTLIGFDDLPADIVVSDINAKSVAGTKSIQSLILLCEEKCTTLIKKNN
jgi:hypothetical protein